MNKFRVFTVVVVLALALSVLAGALPAQAFSQAFYPTQSIGNKGVDVRALQYLLNARGYAVGVDGDLGASTDSAVRSFQSSRGLGVDGIVGPGTWAALVMTIQQASSGDAVKALQMQLNEKRSAGLAVDGLFGSGTRSAVISFQQHAGIGADGIVGPTTWTNLLWHYDYPNFGLASLCDVNPDGNATANWGTGAAIGQLEAGANAFYASYSTRVPVADISFEHGGSIPGHSSHQVGLDVDIWPIRLDGAQCTQRTQWNYTTYDRARTRALIQSIRAKAADHVQVIWFNDTQLINEGLTTYLANHDNHIHIRYCEKIHPNSLYDC